MILVCEYIQLINFRNTILWRMDLYAIKNWFMLREIAGQSVVVPIGSEVVEFNGIMTLSESGALYCIPKQSVKQGRDSNTRFLNSLGWKTDIIYSTLWNR